MTPARFVYVVVLTLVFGAPAGSALTAPSPPPGGHYEARDQALDRFWAKAERILDVRLGHISEGEHTRSSVTVEVGAVGMNARDKRRLRRAAPGPWVELEMFSTQYSIADLRGFGHQAEEALEQAGLHELWGGFGYLHEPDEISITLARDDSKARDVLRDELPDGAFTIEIGLAPPASESTESFGRGWLLPILVGLIASWGLAIGFLRLKRRGETFAPPRPAR